MAAVSDGYTACGGSVPAASSDQLLASHVAIASDECGALWRPPAELALATHQTVVVVTVTTTCRRCRFVLSTSMTVANWH